MAAVPTRRQLISFLNALPTATVADEWIKELRDAIRDLFPDIDLLIIFYNLLDPKHQNSDLNWSNLAIVEDSSSALGFSADAVSQNLEERLLQDITDDIAAYGHTPDFYHPPTTFNYIDQTWIASMILLRERSKPPFSTQMISAFAELEQFFLFAFKDHNLRYHAEHPADTLFYDAILQITEQVGLTLQEMRVLMLRLLGRSYKEIGTMLGVSASTVKNHLNAVHNKAGVHTQSELFARYFAPKFGLLSTYLGRHIDGK